MKRLAYTVAVIAGFGLLTFTALDAFAAPITKAQAENAAFHSWGAKRGFLRTEYDQGTDTFRVWFDEALMWPGADHSERFIDVSRRTGKVTGTSFCLDGGE